MKLRLTSRIVLFFVLLATALLAVVGALSYRKGSKSLQAAAVSEMLAAAVEKEAALDTWIEERLNDLAQISGPADVAEKAATLIAAPPASAAARAAHAVLLHELEPHLAGLHCPYLELFVLEPESGKVIASTSPAQEGKCKLSLPYFDNGKQGLYFQAPYHSADLAAPAMTAAVPLRAADGRVVAVLAARLDLAAMNAIAQRRTGLRQTEDAFLFNAEQFPVTQPRFIHEPAVLSRKLDTEAIRRCAAANNGVALAPDYRGVPSIAVYRWNAKRQLGLIVKIDQAEALAPARAFGWSVALISVLALLATVGLALLLARSITRPLLSLSDRVRRFAEGNSAEPLPEPSGDEVSLLAREFDRMAARVGERAAELAKTNEAMRVENTERRRIEQSLHASQQLVEGIINAMPMGVFWKDENLVFSGCNAAFARDAGFADPKDIIGKDAYQMVWRAQAELYRADDRQVIESGCAKLLIEEPHTTPAGNIITLLTSKTPLRNSQGEASGVIGVYMDITERKQAEAAIEKAHKELVDVSRQAGMAEIATNVLHNVGNVLNSVNISTGLIVQSVKQSKASSLARVVTLLQEHAHDLGEFITQDSRGKHVPAHLAQLAEHLQAEQQANVRELELLRRNVEHIKQIVAMQQNYASFGGVKEMINVVHLVEDSLRINEGDLSRHELEVVREFEEVPPLNSEKHKILQILVNLLRNAKYACQDSERADKRLTVRVANGEGRVRISVMDNGVGIPPENLTRIFNHGFTTRKDGHGFGLHSGALAAKEMGGSLTVHSDGPGQGAEFTLELPCNPPGMATLAVMNASNNTHEIHANA